MATKIGFVSLGCPKNQLDLEVMLGHLVSEGYMITDAEDADIVVINTCAFIESAKKESIDNILDIAWLKENGSLKGIVVTGCMAEKYREEIMTEMPEVDALLGTGSVHSIVEAIKAVAKGKKFTEFKDKNEVKLGGDRIVTTGDAMAYLKISEGCDNCCTYCAIPKLRGRFRSRPMEDLIKEAKELVSLGIKEIVIVGQDTTSYGIDLYGEYALYKLIRRISEETDITWIRALRRLIFQSTLLLAKTRSPLIAISNRTMSSMKIVVRHSYLKAKRINSFTIWKLKQSIFWVISQ